MALINFDSDRDPWLLEYESCEKLQREIMEQLTLRTKEPRTTETYARLSANIRLRMKQYGVEIKQLRQKLDQAYNIMSITSEEEERRSRQIELLQSKEFQMQKLFNQHKTIDEDRNRLLGVGAMGSSRNYTAVDWGVGDDPPLFSVNSTENNVQDMKTTQQQMLSEQERGLDELSNIISRQKNIAETISTEVDMQNDLIDDIAERVENTDSRIANETGYIHIFSRKDNTCGYWIVIVILFISILIVTFI